MEKVIWNRDHTVFIMSKQLVAAVLIKSDNNNNTILVNLSGPVELIFETEPDTKKAIELFERLANIIAKAN